MAYWTKIVIKSKKNALFAELIYTPEYLRLVITLNFILSLQRTPLAMHPYVFSYIAMFFHKYISHITIECEKKPFFFHTMGKNSNHGKRENIPNMEETLKNFPNSKLYICFLSAIYHFYLIRWLKNSNLYCLQIFLYIFAERANFTYTINK